MEKLLKKMRDTRELVAVYYKSTNGACTGFVRELDDEFMLLELISPNGRADGFTIVRLDEILKMDARTSYLRNLSRVYAYYGDPPQPIKLKDKDLLLAFLDYASKNGWLTTMTLGFETIEKISGFIVGRDWNALTVRLVGENGEDDGFTRFEYEDLVSASACTEFEKYLVVLHELENAVVELPEKKKRANAEEKNASEGENVLSFPFGK